MHYEGKLKKRWKNTQFGFVWVQKLYKERGLDLLTRIGNLSRWTFPTTGSRNDPGALPRHQHPRPPWGPPHPGWEATSAAVILTALRPPSSNSVVRRGVARNVTRWRHFYISPNRLANLSSVRDSAWRVSQAWDDKLEYWRTISWHHWLIPVLIHGVIDVELRPGNATSFTHRPCWLQNVFMLEITRAPWLKKIRHG